MKTNQYNSANYYNLFSKKNHLHENTYSNVNHTHGDMLTSEPKHQVIMKRPEQVSDWTDWNDFSTSGTYAVVCPNSSYNPPPNSYYYGTLLVMNTGASVSQIYLPHNSSHVMQYRTFWSGGAWTAWANVGYSQRNVSTLEEPDVNINTYDEKIKSLEERIERLEAIIKERNR